jgi:hypothetical protein
MYLDYRRMRAEELMRQNGPPCGCGRRVWRSEPSRYPELWRFRCAACSTVVNVPATVLRELELEHNE